MHPALLTLSALLLVGCVHGSDHRPLVEATQSRTILFQDVRVFTAVEGQDALEHRDVLVEDGVIAAIGQDLPAPERAHLIDGAGRTLMPGLVDAHVHTTFAGASPPWYRTLPDNAHALQAHLYAGVTSAFDMGGSTAQVTRQRDELAAGRLLGPSLRVAGVLNTAPGGYPTGYIERTYDWPMSAIALQTGVRQIHDVHQARAQVERLHRLGVDHIKVVVAETPAGIEFLQGRVLVALCDTAHQRGLKVAAHVDTADNALRAARAGVDVLVHGIHSTRLTEAQAAELARLGVAVVPTLVTWERLTLLVEERFVTSALEAESEDPSLLAALADNDKARAYDTGERFTTWLRHMASLRQVRLDNVRELHQAGVQILAGSDASGSLGIFAGGIHDELRLLASAGLSNREVLLGATSRAARMLAKRGEPAPDFGTVELGKRADLLLVEGDPLEDITASAKIVAVVRQGVLLSRLTPARTPSSARR